VNTQKSGKLFADQNTPSSVDFVDSFSTLFEGAKPLRMRAKTGCHPERSEGSHKILPRRLGMVQR
jgi:hypothetical protein